MRRLLPASALAVTMSLLLAGCVSAAVGDPTGTPSDPGASAQATRDEPDVAPAAGDTVTGDGYSYVIPEGWQVADASVAPMSDTMAYDPADADGFADNVNVVISPSGLVPPDTLETAGAAELKSYNATDIVVEDRVSLNGDEATHMAAAMTQQGTTYLIEQFGINSDTQTYIVTFSFSETVAAADREALAMSVLVTWSFA